MLEWYSSCTLYMALYTYLVTINVQLLFCTAPLVNEPKNGAGSSKVKERISYRHQYNCRTDPNEPVRGKVTVHG